MARKRTVAEPSPEAERWRALWKRIEDLPQEPIPPTHPRHWYGRAKRALDFIGHASHPTARFFRGVNPYPKPWVHVKFRTGDGVQIAGWLGPQHEGVSSPFGLVIVPGMFSTKDDSIHKRRAIHIWRHWKVPVIVIDTRAFGESTGIATAGWKEALDVIAAAEVLQSQSDVRRVGVIAESLGGAAALNALAHDSASGKDLFGGGVLTWSAFVDARDAVDYISRRPPRNDPFYPTWAGFRTMLRLRSKGAYESFMEYLRDTAEVNGLKDVDELLDLANPKWKVSMMHQPTLCIHATDDPVVPVRHARRMERYARDYPHIRTITTPWGGHTHFEALDAWWFWEVTRIFFGDVNDMEFPNLSEHSPTGRRSTRPAPRPQP